MSVNVLWFRHGLRLHDNPALLEALADREKGIALVPIFIFDGESAGTKCTGYNRLRFLLDSLRDLDDQFRCQRGRLYTFQGNPTTIFKELHECFGINKLCVEQDCEPIWNRRDNDVKELCNELGIKWVEKISHTLWNPRQVIQTNGGIPPLTYQMFLHTVQVIGLPPRPAENPNWKGVDILNINETILEKLPGFTEIPQPEQFNVFAEDLNRLALVKWKGGETEALILLEERLKVEGEAFKRGYYLPNQANPNILETPKSMSPHLRFGCLSVRKFYWAVHDLFEDVQQHVKMFGFQIMSGAHITGQLIWREYFYTMSVNNPYYDRMEENEICLNIPWAPVNDEQLENWKLGKTGFPLVDAAMRQLLAEGWIHHTLRNTVATFLTRGGLWFNWEHGLQHFLKYLLDADWSVCAGNWMWVSSSAFERLLDSSLVTCPLAMAKRLDPFGQYIKQYVPELAHVPKEYIHEPWRMPLSEQKRSKCIIGEHYPKRIIDFVKAAESNMTAMRNLRQDLMEGGAAPPPHCRPSDEAEVRQFFWLV